MLSVRNAVLAAVGLLVLSIVASLLTMVREPDSEGMGNDSFGTRGYGYRALFEMLDELDVAVTREYAPPNPEHLQTGTIVFLKPAHLIVATEPSYLTRLQSWVNEGGRLVVAPDRSDDAMTQMTLAQLSAPTPDFLSSIGLNQVRLLGGGNESERSARLNRSRKGPRSAEGMAEDIFSAINDVAPPLREVEVQVEGDFPELDDVIGRLTLPAEGVASLQCDQPPDGSLVVVSADKSAQMLVARFERGAGEIIVVSEPLLLTNRLLSQSDNSILAARLLAPEQQSVVFDEFYHGLGVRGQPLYLLTRLSFASTTIAILLTLGLSTWRKAVIPGPPLADDPVRRRDIREYIHAMANFFAEGGQGRRRLVEELRNGVLRQLNIETGLPPDSTDVERIAAAISRKDGPRAKLLLKSTQSVDEALQSRKRWSQSETLDAMQRMSACL